MYRKEAQVRVEARPLRHRPALQSAVELQAEVVVQAPRGVLLDHEDEALRFARDLPLRLRGRAEIALLPVLVERGAHRLSRQRAGLPRRARAARCAAPAACD